jgi:hypothetical protein
MDNPRSGRWAVWLSFPLILFLVVAAGTGFLLPSVYSGETRFGLAQLAGSDGLNLAVVVPTLLVAAVFALRGSMGGRLVWAGTVLYVIYDFIYYTLTTHFNSLFLVYCAVLGLAFYALIGVLPALSIADAARRYTRPFPARATAVLFLLIALGASVNWMKQMVPAVLSGQAPPGVRDSGAVTEPAAVLDFAFVLPALTLSAILLLLRRPLGFVFGPILLVFTALLALLLTAMGMVMDARGFGPAFGGTPMNLAIALIAALLLTLFLRKEKRLDAALR